MSNRRILSLWFPRLGAERLLRRGHLTNPDDPFAVIRDVAQTQVISSMNPAAEAKGLTLGQPLRDAQAMCPDLITRIHNPIAEAQFLTVLRRWAGKFSPWVAEEPPDALVIDLTGCAHLFGGEEELLKQAHQDCADLGLTMRAGIADTRGAAWALARYAGQTVTSHRSGDAIDQEARATRSRAAKRRHWERGGAAPRLPQVVGEAGQIAAPGEAYRVLDSLPVAALRLDDHTIDQLARLGLRRIGDISSQPRATLVRRFGRGLVMRLDQAFGSAPEPVSPAGPPRSYAVRMTLPDPIGLEDDIIAVIDRLLPPLCDKLRDAGMGARLLRLEIWRSDQTAQWCDVGLARATDDPDRLWPLIRVKIPDLDAGYGIDTVRLEAVRIEHLSQRAPVGHLEAGKAVRDRLASNTAIDDLIGRIGARIGLEEITRRHPGDSHIPEKGAQVLAAAWSEPAANWPDPPRPRPLLMWRPEPVMAPDQPRLPPQFRWRGRTLTVAQAMGPERIAPEWWLDEPDWRTGTRDYWRVTCAEGDLLWLYFAHGGAMSPGWFCQGAFA